MLRRSLSLVLTLAVVGVVGPPAAGTPRGRALSFTEPLQVEAHNPIGTAIGNGERQPSAEPSIKVDSQGVIYIAGVTSVGQASPLWVSQNDGRSFDELTTPLNWRERSPYGAEGDIAIDAQDRMYFVDTAIPTLAFSRWAPPEGPGDKPSWEFTLPHTLGVLPGFDDRPWLAYGGTGEDDESLWLYVNHVSHVAVYRSTDQGLTWEESTSTFPGQRFFTGMVAAPRDDSQTAYLFGNCGNGTSLCSRDTHDGGQTWRETTVADVDPGRRIGPIMVANAVDSAGVVYGVWSEAGGGCDVFYAASTDGGATWRPKVQVDGPGCSAFPWIAAGRSGRIAIAWYENTAPGPHPDQVPADSQWFLHAAVVTRAPTSSPVIASGVADPNPVRIGPLVRALWDYLQIAIGPDGRFHIAYAEDVTAGPDGPVGTGLNPSNGTNAKDTMYVAQAGGPRIR
ncbi:MAG: hypothetical protein ACRDI0_12905 [Actinomycetota bacterium]